MQNSFLWIANTLLVRGCTSQSETCGNREIRGGVTTFENGNMVCGIYAEAPERCGVLV